MPKAQYKPREERFDLDTVEGGFVSIRTLNYGERLRVRGLLSRMYAEEQAEESKPANRKDRRDKKQKGDESDSSDAYMSFNLEGVYAFQFAHAIVDHNLEKDDGTPFNFKYRSDFRLLDPTVGAEIEDLIEKMNPQMGSGEEVAESPGGPDGAPLVSESGEPSAQESSTPEKTPSLATSST